MIDSNCISQKFHEDILCFSMSWCYAIVSEKGKEGLDPLKRLILLHMFAPVLSQESDVQ